MNRSTTARSKILVASTLVLTTIAFGLLGPATAGAAAQTIPLGSAADFAVLAGSTVTNTGATVATGDLGLSPGTSVTGFPPGVVNGTVHAADNVAAQAKLDLDAAYDDAASRPTTATVPVELGGTTKTPGVYASPAGTFGITGTVTLDAQGDPNAVFIFKAASTLTTASASNVVLVNGARSAEVFWLVGSSATLGTYSVLRGNVMALASITVTTGVLVDGRAMARTAAVTLDTATITRPTGVRQPVATTAVLTSSVNPAAVGEPVGFTAAVTAATGSAVPSGMVVFSDRRVPIAVVALDGTGHAVFTTSALTIGRHPMTATYVGANQFTGSTSPSLVQVVRA
ncbi:ice-binding family protein [Umezawaea sp. Da 62-37]|uniref:ice-binding family protein n=1 Tax=Umezawaea sp. Da 62-37 TaxID=3075927 RepID=UPI0028F72E89|nr:ice-binding family protein [Umezawaea sp. Da 62-37]WNV85286.1 ice-binding family protein [Umezawaea sp. Da 62-37]